MQVDRSTIDTERRRECEADIYVALQTYFPDLFYEDFTEDRREMIDAIMHRIKYGGAQAIAAPRGEGKTTITECVITMCMLWGLLKFPLIVAATGPDATRIFNNIKFRLETSELLHADYPEVCSPIRALEGWASKARMQTVAGQPTRMVWSADYIILPTVDGSKASGVTMACKGLDGSIRGVNYRGIRPDFILIDDPETRESARSEKQIGQRELTIEQDIGGLGGSGKRTATLMLTTLMNHTCLSSRYTDRRAKPAYNGIRQAMIKEMPTNADLWDRYIELRRNGMESGKDADGREAHDYYIEHRDEMDAGAVVSNESRFITDVAEDGRQIEVSAIQHCYNKIADHGWDHFATEYQNNPPDDAGPETNGITALVVRSRINGGNQRVVPAWAEKVTAAIDLRKRWLDWSVFAWRQGAIADVVDYGEDPVPISDGMTVEDALMMALQDRRDAWSLDGEMCMVTPDGEPRPIDLTLVDSGKWTTTVYKFCAESDNTWHPSMGLARYRPQKKRAGVHPGDNWYWSRQESGIWMVDMNTYHWISWLHERFLTEPKDEAGERRRGSLTLFGNQPGMHTDFARQIVSEVYRTEFIEGKGEVGSWYKSGPNHKLDTSYMNCVAASVLGIRLLPAVQPQQDQAAGPRVKPGIKSPDGRPYMVSNRR